MAQYIPRMNLCRICPSTIRWSSWIPRTRVVLSIIEPCRLHLAPAIAVRLRVKDLGYGRWTETIYTLLALQEIPRKLACFYSNSIDLAHFRAKEARCFCTPAQLLKIWLPVIPLSIFRNLSRIPRLSLIQLIKTRESGIISSGIPLISRPKNAVFSSSLMQHCSPMHHWVRTSLSDQLFV